ncbi:MAG: sugar ABC transporter substrate-binding protein [Propionibacteriaceae bacterium]|nr:sugar ABC transporter substrate-binding protein [Propionibacteriaceae bacterium]
MKPVPRLAALGLGALLALSACGMTTDGVPGLDGEPIAVSTEDFQPSDVVTPKDGKVLKIGASFPVLDQFLQNVADGMKERAAAAGVEVNVFSAEEKIDVQLAQIENAIANGVDALIVLPQDTDATGPITAAAKNAGIPLVYVNRRPANLPADVPYVGSDSLVAGHLEMEALAELAGYKGNVAILQGDPSQEAAQQRTQGCKEVVEKYPEMKVIREQAGNWYREKGLEIAENWISSGDDITAICSNNDEMALGAIGAYEQAGKLDSIFIGGVDATSDALAAMAAKKLEVTVFQDAKGQGAGGVDTAIKLYNGEEVPGVLNVPYVLVTPENMSEFQNR